MIRTDAEELGPLLDIDALDWDTESAVRRLDRVGGVPPATASLGQPLGWWGADRLDGKESDRWLLVRFAVSFRAEPGTEVEWARLSVDLPQTPDDHAIVIDQYPDDFLDEEQRDLHLTLSPQLKFMQVSASLGAASASIQIAKVTPVISSWGGQEASFGWDLTRTDRHPIVGVKHFYAIISCPSPELAMSLGIDADVRVPGGFLRRGQRSGPSRQRQVQVLRQQWN